MLPVNVLVVVNTQRPLHCARSGTRAPGRRIIRGNSTILVNRPLPEAWLFYQHVETGIN